MFIQILILFACFGCVVINHQKRGDCKENGPQAFWLSKFWCLMINTICGLTKFPSVCDYSSQDARSTWTKELRKATPQKKTLRRYKRSPRNGGALPTDCLCVEHRTVRWHTGLSGAHTPDCPVHQGIAAQWLVLGGTRREDHRTIRWHTGLFGVESLRRQRSPALTRGLTGQLLGTPDCPVCRREQQLFSNGYNCVGGYKYTPTNHSQV
jgi:hypothetical protein